MAIDAPDIVRRTDLPSHPRRQGKVRDVYDLGNELLLVATDRISAYDVVLPTPIPGKGVMLTQISRFWFEWLSDSVRHHLIEVVEDHAPPGLDDHLEQLCGRTMRCRKTEVVPIECVVRGHLAGSGWADYGRCGRVCGLELPPGLQQCARLPEPIFTPATKADVGHDQNITFEEAADAVGGDVMTLLARRSLDIYNRAAKYARDRGIIVADTKFEWGKVTGPDGQDEYILIDEVLTPDSSRFWPASSYEPGQDQESFDKQYVRNYLTGLVEAGQWDKTDPGPDLPDDIVRNTAAKYREALDRLLP
ncbi:MAG: phosphoribosylaminoimidazolesuccinocarboxamide synthase [Phycisphaerae bacterium]